MDAASGDILAEQNDHQQLPPASLTKVLTALIASGWLPPNCGIPVSPEAAAAYPDTVGMKPGQVWPLPMAMQALLLFSANDAAYSIAERIAGNLNNFGPVMDQAAQQMGMTDHPTLHDPAGLDSNQGIDGGNLLSAWDLAIAGRDLLANPQLAPIVNERRTDFVDPAGVARSFPSKNMAFLNSVPGAVGIKTGYTSLAGQTLIGAATQGGRTLIAVVLNGTDPAATAHALISDGFAVPLPAKPVGVLPRVVQPNPNTGQVNTPPLAATHVLPLTDRKDPDGLPVSVPMWQAGGAGAVLLVAVAALVLVVARRRRKKPVYTGAHTKK